MTTGSPTSPAPTTRRRRRRALASALAVVVTALVPLPAGAQAPEQATGGTPSPEQELVERYAPIVMLKAQDAPCDPDGEPYAPQAVDIVLDNPDVVLRQVGNQDPILKVAPSAADLHGRSEGFFLDFPGSALAPGCIYEQDFDRYTGTVTGAREPVVYAHIATQADEPDRLAVQYWFYWYYNDWNNKHESDWEGIQLLFDVGTVEAALRTEPVSAGYAQHEGGERAAWDSSKLEREGSRPVVYPSKGSHASYYGAALYLGRGASEGFGCDTTDGPSVRTDPSVILLPTSSSGPDDEFAWLEFGGRWGERQSGAFNGPTGPQGKERWTQPIDWHDELRTSSVVVPSGDGDAEAVINMFCDVVEWGSGALVTFKTSPLRILVTLAIIASIGVWLARRTVWDDIPTPPLIRRRRAGQIIRVALRSSRRHPRLLVTIGLFSALLSLLVAASAALLHAIPLVSDVTAVASGASEVNLAFVLLAGSIGGALGLVAANAIAVSYFDLLDAGEASPDAAVRRAWSCSASLLAGFGRSLLFVVGLLASVIGAPVGIWLLVRYQFMAHVVVTEGRNGRGALARSSGLVAGRWWYTAAVVAVVNLLVAATGMVVGLLLLVVAADIPLWLYSGLVTLVLALIVPLAAVAQTLLFGDAVARQREIQATPNEPASMSAVGV